jgi:hypothetical protein
MKSTLFTHYNITTESATMRRARARAPALVAFSRDSRDEPVRDKVLINGDDRTASSAIVARKIVKFFHPNATATSSR